MKERPILFSSSMVRAILNGSKSQTRRVIKPQPDESIQVGHYHPALVDKDGEQYPGDEVFGAYTEDGEYAWKCPYGQVGDRLWVREKALYWTGGAGGTSDVVYHGDPEIPNLLKDNNTLLVARETTNII